MITIVHPCRRMYPLLVLLCLFVPAELAAQRELFPLRPGLRYDYAYRFFSYSYDGVMPAYEYTKWGTVQYVILDSSVANDTTIVWHVLQTDSLVQQSPYPGDTLMLTRDTLNMFLYEDRRGLHELSTWGLVWYFPNLSGAPVQRVFRYGASDTVMLHADSANGYFKGIFHDTLWFSSASGLFRHSRIEKISTPGMSWWQDTLAAELQANPVLTVDAPPMIPDRIQLYQNYPNPFNPSTTIRYELPKSSMVKLSVYDLLGREVSLLVNDRKNAGLYEVRFDGARLSSGVYFYRLQAGGYTQARTLCLIR